MFDTPPASIPHIKAGKLRPLAVTTATRVEMLPDIPTVDEFVPGYEASAVAGFGAPKNTPNEIVDRLNREINASSDDPKIKERLEGLGGIPISMTPAEFGKLIADETEKWGKVIRAAGITAE
jgi:tripartite-type tricarboxylate transporter receptor subunit TctC